MTKKMKSDTFARLTELRLKGGMAAALLIRGTEPSPHEIQTINQGGDYFTVRKIAEFMHGVGFRMDFELHQTQPGPVLMEADDEGETGEGQ